MKVKFKTTGNSYDLNFKAEMFSKIEDEYKELELELYEDVFVLLNSSSKLVPKYLADNYDIKYLVNAFLYFGAEEPLEKLSEYLQKKEICNFVNENSDFSKFLRNEILLEEFLEEYMADFILEFPEEKKFFPREWEKCGIKEILPDGKIRWTFKNFICWEQLSENPSISEAFFEKHIYDVHWSALSKNPSISEAFFEKHISKICWQPLSQNPSISEAFFEKHIDKVWWGTLSRNPSISEAFFERHVKDVNWDWLSGNPSLSEAFFEKYIDTSGGAGQQSCKVNWICLSGNPSLSEAFFEKHIDKIDWASLSWNSSISEAFFEKHINKVEWQFLSQNPSISEAFFEKHIDKVDWYILSENPSLSEAFFEKHIDKIRWNSIFQNEGLSEKFMKKYWKSLKSVSMLTAKMSLNFVKDQLNVVPYDESQCMNISSINFRLFPWREFFDRGF